MGTSADNIHIYIDMQVGLPIAGSENTANDRTYWSRTWFVTSTDMVPLRNASELHKVFLPHVSIECIVDADED